MQRLRDFLAVAINQPQVVGHVRGRGRQRDGLFKGGDGASLIRVTGQDGVAQIGRSQVGPHHRVVGIAFAQWFQDRDRLGKLFAQDTGPAQVQGRVGVLRR